MGRMNRTWERYKPANSYSLESLKESVENAINLDCMTPQHYAKLYTAIIELFTKIDIDYSNKLNSLGFWNYTSTKHYTLDASYYTLERQRSIYLNNSKTKKPDRIRASSISKEWKLKRKECQQLLGKLDKRFNQLYKKR